MKTIALFLALAMVLTLLVGCGEKNAPPSDVPTQGNIQTPQQADQAVQQTVDSSVEPEGDTVELGELI